MSQVLLHKQILDNAMVVMHTSNRRTSGYDQLLALKLEISEVYDRVEWGFRSSYDAEYGF